jgi:hypothetical protein
VNPPGSTSIVITDTSILINLSHTGHLSLLGKVVGLRFVVPDEVVAEVTETEQLRILEAAIADGSLTRESIASPDELALSPSCPRPSAPANRPASLSPQAGAGLSPVMRSAYSSEKLAAG